MAEEKSSWRDTLYVWDGILFPEKTEEESDAAPLRWEGFWVECEDCPDARKAEAPKRRGAAKDVESPNSFCVKGTAKPIDKKNGKEDTDENKDSPASTANPHLASLADGEGWDMGEGEEKKKYKDDMHDVLLTNIRWMGNAFDERDNLVFATGSNEFGKFISAGWMRPGNRITLARRYLPSDEDARAKWDLDELKGAVVAEIYDANTGSVRTPPWQCAALHSEFQGEQSTEPPSKKSKKE